MSGPRVVTFGCRLNAYESEVVRRLAAEAGHHDAVVINTCAVTAEAERQARQAIRRARRDNPEARIVVTGCAAQLDPARFAAMPEVDRVLGNAEKLSPEAWAPRAEAPVAVGDIMAVRETAAHLIEGFESRARAFVQVQQGCDHRCTFCIIPFARGPSRSVPAAAVVAQVRRLVENGMQEVVLTGVDLTDYGRDLPGRPTLGGLARKLLAEVPALARLRLSSLDPVEVDDDLMRLIGDEERLMPHLHLSLQAGDDLILKRMRRRHGRAEAIAFCDEVRRRRPDIAFGADLIAGFPTEDEAMFRNTETLVDACGLVHLHVFPFSARPGTPAARMPQVPAAERKARAERLRRLGAARRAAWLEGLAGRRLGVLAEDGRRGRSEHYAPVMLDREATPGAVVAARALGRDGEALAAAVLP